MPIIQWKDPTEIMDLFTNQTSLEENSLHLQKKTNVKRSADGIKLMKIIWFHASVFLFFLSDCKNQFLIPTVKMYMI